MILYCTQTLITDAEDTAFIRGSRYETFSITTYIITLINECNYTHTFYIRPDHCSEAHEYVGAWFMTLEDYRNKIINKLIK